MKNQFLLPLVFGLIGCTHGATQDASRAPLGAIPYTTADGVRYLNSNDRAPAQSGNAKNTWTTKTLAWNVTGKGGQLEPQVAKIEQVTEWQSSEEFNEEDDVLVWEGFVQAKCTDWDCGTSEADGQSLAWTKFLAAKKEMKAAALAEAIKGLTAESAKALVSGNFFAKKPRSWAEFSAELHRAEKEKAINKRVFHEAVYEHRDENIISLGYSVNGGQCRPVIATCEKWDQKWVRQLVKKQRTVTTRKVLSTVDREVYINVVDPQLQPWEIDNIYVKIGSDPRDVIVSTEGPTVYKSQMSVQGKKTLIQINGVERKRLALPRDIFRKAGEQYVQQGTQAIFTVAIDPKYVPPSSTTDRLELEYRVQWCKPTWAGPCDPLKAWESAPVKRGPIAANGQAVVKANVPAGSRTKVVYSAVRVGSKWYSDTPTASLETPAIRIR